MTLIKIAFAPTLPSSPFFSFQVKNIPSSTRRTVSLAKRVTVTMRDHSFWVLPLDKTVVTTALEANITRFIFTESDLQEQCSKIGHFSKAILVDKHNRFPGGLFAALKTPEDVDHLMQQPGRFETVIVDPRDWKQIPVENLVAAYQSSSTDLLAVVDSAEEASTMLSSLERGVDGVILRAGQTSQITQFARLMHEVQATSTNVHLTNICSATLTAVRSVGVGSRVCIDTCSLLQEDEGILTGSASQGMILALSEAAKVQYCPSRPFRVNAGSVHSYCLLPEGKTKYLCEIEAGDQILIVKNGGQSCRTAVVGRSKIETRPLLMLGLATVDADGASHNFNVFLQNAETVRVATVHNNQYRATSICELQVGDRVLMRTDSHARHIGRPIDEDLIEK